MRRVVALVAGGLPAVAIAVAAADIPARYVGPFPPLGRATNLTGTFSGSTLVLTGTLIMGTRFATGTGRFRCARISSNQTRCRGRVVTDDGQLALQRNIVITWANGVPVAMGH